MTLLTNTSPLTAIQGLELAPAGSLIPQRQAKEARDMTTEVVESVATLRLAAQDD